MSWRPMVRLMTISDNLHSVRGLCSTLFLGKIEKNML